MLIMGPFHIIDSTEQSIAGGNSSNRLSAHGTPWNLPASIVLPANVTFREMIARGQSRGDGISRLQGKYAPGRDPRANDAQF